MNTQQSSWLALLGITKAPTVNPNASKIKRHGNCFIENNYADTQQLKADIKEKLDGGMAGCMNIFNALASEGKVPAKNGTIMTMSSFRSHYINTVRANRIDVSGRPRGVLQKQIVDLFDSGVSEPDISNEHGFDRSHVYNTLIMCGRIQKRHRGNRIDAKSLKITQVKKLLKTSGDIKSIAKKSGASEKYIRQLKLARSRIIMFFNRGMDVDDICKVSKISRVYVESVVEELQKETNNVITQ